MFKLWRTSLLFQVVGSFSLLSITIMVLVGVISFRNARQSLQESAFNQLTTAAALKEAELNRWLRDRQDTLLSFSRLPSIRRQTQILFETPRETAAYRAAQQELQAHFASFLEGRDDYREITVLSRGGQVLASNNPDRVGWYNPINQSREIDPQNHDESTFIYNFYPDSHTRKPTATFSVVLTNDEGQRMGMIAVHLNLQQVDEVIGNNQGLGKTGASYLVADIGGNFTSRVVFVDANRFGSDQFPAGVTSPGIQEAIKGKDGQGLYQNYNGVPVLGVYRWLEQQNVAFLVEVSQAEAFAPARQLAQSMVGVGVGLVGLLTPVIVILGWRIVAPISVIAETAQSVGSKVRSGYFSHLQRVPVSTDNEIGELARNFNAMTQQLEDSYEALEDYSHTLEAKVKARTEELVQNNQSLQATLKELRQTQAQLIQTEKMASLGQMIAGIAHEINNPINFIHGNVSHLNVYAADLLKLVELYEQEYSQTPATIAQQREEMDLDFLRQDLPKILDSMQIGTHRIREIVLSLRNFSRLDESDYKEADLQGGLDSTLLILQNRLKLGPGLPKVEIMKDYGDLPLVGCYPSQLNQVFLNLINNAIDALEPLVLTQALTEPVIRLTTAQVDEVTIQVRIQDNGPGIDPETQSKIFDPFFTTKPVGKGTGLGLSICYSIVVERHQGSLECFSTVGQGTEFVVTLPIGAALGRETT